MKWTKPRFTFAGVLVLAVITLVAAVKLFFFPSIKAEYFKQNYGKFQKVPDNLLVVRPTRFSFPAHGYAMSSYTRITNGQYNIRYMGRNITLEQAIAMAYQASPWQVVSPPDKAPGRYDLLVKLFQRHGPCP
jgi:hypothetical protein